MFAFIVTAVGISLSAIMAPGPMTVATLAAGMRSRHAGVAMTLGHITVELPMLILLACGAGVVMELPGVRPAIGIIGGGFLLWMAYGLIKNPPIQTNSDGIQPKRHPYWTGVVLSGANPYFILWWATVGLALVTQALGIGIAALVLFVLVHWMCDFGWLELLSLTGNKGGQMLGEKTQKRFSAGCGVALFFFGLKFVYDAAEVVF